MCIILFAKVHYLKQFLPTTLPVKCNLHLCLCHHMTTHKQLALLSCRLSAGLALPSRARCLTSASRSPLQLQGNHRNSDLTLSFSELAGDVELVFPFEHHLDCSISQGSDDGHKVTAGIQVISRLKPLRSMSRGCSF